jgi:hypothetical protein
MLPVHISGVRLDEQWAMELLIMTTPGSALLPIQRRFDLSTGENVRHVAPDPTLTVILVEIE